MTVTRCLATCSAILSAWASIGKAMVNCLRRGGWLLGETGERLFTLRHALLCGAAVASCCSARSLCRLLYVFCARCQRNIRRCGGTGDDFVVNASVLMSLARIAHHPSSRHSSSLQCGRFQPERTERTGSAFGPGEMAAGWALGAAKLPSRDDGAQCTRETTMSCHS